MYVFLIYVCLQKHCLQQFLQAAHIGYPSLRTDVFQLQVASCRKARMCCWRSLSMLVTGRILWLGVHLAGMRNHRRTHILALDARL